MSDLARKRDTDSKFLNKMGGPHLKVVNLFGNFKLKSTNSIKTFKTFSEPQKPAGLLQSSTRNLFHQERKNPAN